MSTTTNSGVSATSLVTQSGEPHHSVTLTQAANSLNTVGGEHTADRSAALLSLASSCSLSEILSAQQQALEQIHTQIHLAQQFESITNRLDAIERTLNSLISQRTSEDHHVESPSVTASTSLLETPTGVTPPMSCITVQTANTGSTPLISVEKKSKKLPRDLCVSSL